MTLQMVPKGANYFNNFDRIFRKDEVSIQPRGNCEVRFRDAVLTGNLLGILDGRATVLLDGYECSDSFPLEDLLRFSP